MIPILIDTHIVLWLLDDLRRVGSQSQKLLWDTSNVIYISSVSAWEIALLLHKGKIRTRLNAIDFIEQATRSFNAEHITLDYRCAIEAYNLASSFHGDPGDRMLAATARIHELQLMTADKNLIRYRGVKTISAVK